MAAPDKWLYEYAVVRFVPRIDREEFLNIGLVMMCKRQKWLKGLIWLDQDRIKNLFPSTNFELLKNQAALFESTEVPQKDLPVEEKFRWLTAMKSAVLQTSPSHPGILDIKNEKDPDSKSESLNLLQKEFDRLFNQLVLI